MVNIYLKPLKTILEREIKKTKDIVQESKVSRTTAKADIKDAIKGKAFPKGTKPSDFIPGRGRRFRKKK